MARIHPAAVALLALLPLAGCALKETAGPAIESITLHGNTHGGQQPVSGAHIYLFYTTNTVASANGSAAVSAIGTGTAAPGFPVATDSLGNYVTTDANGNFDINLNYSCTANNQLYALAIGGNPGLPGAVNNPGIALMASLDRCSTDFKNTFIMINEVTTVAAAYAFGPMLAGPAKLGSSMTNVAIGQKNAGDLVSILVNQRSGQANAKVGANGTLPYLKLNALANAMATCINTDGTVSGPTNPTPCYTFFNLASDGVTKPMDTITAMVNIVKNQNRNVSGLIGLSSGIAPFQPAASTATDFSMPVFFSLDSSTQQTYLGIDASGNFYKATADTSGTGTGGYANKIQRVDHTGTVGATLTSSAENTPTRIFLTADSLFTLSGNSNKIGAYNLSTTATMASSGFTSTAAGEYSIGVVTDATANTGATVSPAGSLLYILGRSNKLNTVSPIAPFGTPVAYSLTGAPTNNSNRGSLAITSDGNIWVEQGAGSSAGPGITRVATSALASSVAVTDNLTASAANGNIIIDNSGNIWLLQYDGAAHTYLSAWNASNTALTGSPYTITDSGLTYYQVNPDNSGKLWLTGSYTFIGVSSSAPGTVLTKITNSDHILSDCKPTQSGEVACATDGGILIFPGLAAPTTYPTLKNSHAAAP